MTTRALVLGGGGPIGVAWESGLIAGFAQAGVDLSRARHVLGTSAGAIVGARLRLAADPARLADPELSAVARPQAPVADLGGGDFPRVLALMAEAEQGARNPAEVRREMGAIALAAQTMPLEPFVGMIARTIGAAPPEAWPQGLACTAVDAEDGGFQLWDERSGAPFFEAVASSCAVPGVFPPVPILGRRYMDGGMRSVTNADLAAGHDIVVVVSVLGPDSGHFAGRQVAEEVESLKSGGADVVLISPDGGAAEAMGQNLMDMSRAAPAARAGLAQAAAQDEVLRQVWR